MVLRGLGLAGLVVFAGWVSVALGAGGECSNQAVRERQPHGLLLPDCRAIEQVSPVDKGGQDARGFPGQMQASTDGGRARYFSLSPFPDTPSNASGLPTYVSSRGGLGSWANAGVMPAASQAAQVRGFSSDLSEGVAWAEGKGPGGEPLEHRTYYLHNLQVKDPTTEGFSELYEAQEPISEAALFALGGFSGDGTRMVFESGLKLLPEARAGALNAYQWDASQPAGHQLSLIGLLPNEETPPEGSIIGTSAGASLTALQPPPAYNPGVISRDGSRVFFTATPSGRVYARLQGSHTIAISPGGAEFLGATPDGRYAFYSEGGALYRYDLGSSEPALEEPAVAITPPAGALGLLGFSDDGATVYFAAEGVLAANKREYETVNSKGESEQHTEEATTAINTANLYEWHTHLNEPPTTTFLATLSNLFEIFGDEGDWRDRLGAKFLGLQHSARVTPDGHTLLFASRNGLTGYDSGSCLGNTKPCQELFRYHETEGPPTLTCVSCNPTGKPGTSDVLLAGEGGSTHGTNEPYLTRNLSENGQRVFFQADDQLLPADTNSVTDVYEWEAEGEGTCTTHTLNNGCLYLISTGTSTEPSYLGDASANGDDVFFFTRQPLASTDPETDVNADLYDARVNGGPPPEKNKTPPEPCTSYQECRPPTTPPTFNNPNSTGLTDNGNLPEQPPPTPTPPHKKLTNKQLLAKALAACHKKHNKHKRAQCEKQAHKHYPTKTTKHKSTTSRRTRR